MEQHLHILDAVLERLYKYGLKANKTKCKFLQDTVEYCGHAISSTALRQVDQKVQAITQVQARPQDVTQLSSFLGMLQYYAKFLPILASQLETLRQLLQKDTKWAWKREQENCFKTVNDLLLQDWVLTHFDPELPVTLACDSST